MLGKMNLQNESQDNAYKEVNNFSPRVKNISSFTNTDINNCLKEKKAVTRSKVGLMSNFKRDSALKSPKPTNFLRKSQASPNIFTERITLNQKRYDHKMAKNNSHDNMGYLSNGYESNDNSIIREAQPARKTTASVADHLSVKSERPKVSFGLNLHLGALS